MCISCNRIVEITYPSQLNPTFKYMHSSLQKCTIAYTTCRRCKKSTTLSKAQTGNVGYNEFIATAIAIMRISPDNIYQSTYAIKMQQIHDENIYVAVYEDSIAYVPIEELAMQFINDCKAVSIDIRTYRQKNILRWDFFNR